MKILKTISVFSMGFLVLISSSSFIVGIHRCAGEIQNMALLSRAEGCGMEKNVPLCHKHVSEPCCEDETVLHQGEGFKASVPDISVSASPPIDLELPHVILSEVIPAVTFLQPQYYNYDPPLRTYDLTVSHLVFLI